MIWKCLLFLIILCTTSRKCKISCQDATSITDGGDVKEPPGYSNEKDDANSCRSDNDNDDTSGECTDLKDEKENVNEKTSNEKESSCVDYDEKCEEWAKDGECINDYEYMIPNCPKSCEFCEEDCVDEEEDCEEWAEDSWCPYEPEYMYSHCKKSCSACPSMVNYDTDFGEEQSIYKEELEEETMEIIEESIIYMKHIISYSNFTTVRSSCKNNHANCSVWAAQGWCDDDNDGEREDMRWECGPACQSCEVFDRRNICPIDPYAVNAFGAGDLNRMFERLTEGSEFVQFEPIVLSRPKMKKESETDDDGPWVVMFEKFITDSEIKKLIDYGETFGYERSEDVGDILDDGSYDSEISSHRTSYNTWCDTTCEKDPVVITLLERIHNFTNAPIVNFESLQLLKYEVGQYYHEHHDYIEHHLERPCGVRVLTFFLYLNDVEEGGGTHFPTLNMTVMPKRGRALLWPSVLDEDPNVKDERTNHEALVVEKGYKYGANAWIHMRDFQTALMDGCTS